MLRKISYRILMLVVLCFCATYSLKAADTDAVDSLRLGIGRVLTRIAQRQIKICPIEVTDLQMKSGKLRIRTSLPMTYYPVREDNLAMLYDSIRSLLPQRYKTCKIEIISDENKPLEEYIPLYHRSSRRGVKPYVNDFDGVPLSRRQLPYEICSGLQNRHIAIWQSHGRFFDAALNDWRWQRPLLWQTVEDLFTQSYVVPYLVPMLENAGANVLLPRERDFQTEEIIVDNDGGIIDVAAASYAEGIGSKGWQTHNSGFAYKQRYYLTGENPFRQGTSRFVESVTDGKQLSVARWSAKIPADGDYAVYVTYATTEQSADDATYIINYDGGTSHVKVNQRMGGGTWIYLGTYRFLAGDKRPIVTLTNLSSKRGRIVSADAVKIGGGYGNIARCSADTLMHADNRPVVSSLPRVCEAARYWLQWAGFDQSVYNATGEGASDYKDDYMSRGLWVNALMGGSKRLPKETGLNIPIDLAFAFHSDAGITDSDSTTIGTLGIYYTKCNKQRYGGGVSRYRSRDLTDMVMSQIHDDIATLFHPEWRRRGMWNRSYYEARVPETPTMLLELLSHQNFGDMRLGHNPDFKFAVSRAIYKAMLRYLSSQYDCEYCVQPLPITHFSVTAVDNESVELSWQPTVDSLEPTAVARRYIVRRRVGNGGFDGGIIVDRTSIVMKQEPDKIYSYRVSALNDGGESFPSETLAACLVSGAKGCAMVVNGFDRVDAPAMADDGFHNEFDSGVAYCKDVAFTGEQRVFDVSRRREKQTLRGFGASTEECIGTFVGGNTFDYAYVHGASFVANGYSFVSSSRAAFESEAVTLQHYAVVDLILGKQRRTRISSCKPSYACFPIAMQQRLKSYLAAGGTLFASGAYIGYDLFEDKSATKADADFAREVLHFDYLDFNTSNSSTITSKSRLKTKFQPSDYTICRQYRPEFYRVDSTDALRPIANSSALLYYTDSKSVAAVGYNGWGSTVVFGFPFESIVSEDERNRLMYDILNFINLKTKQ